MYVWTSLINFLPVVVIGLPVLSIAQQTIQGDLSGELGPGTYVVTGHCRVNIGHTLRILPGTTLLHSGSYRWNVNGQLTAIGTEDEPIVFTRRDPIHEHRWGGLCFYPGSDEHSRLEWCQFDNCFCINYPYDQGGVIYLGHVAIPIAHCTFSQSYATWGGAIYADYSDSLVIEDCVFSYNNSGNGGGVYLNHCTNSVVRNCVVWGNEAEST